MFLRFCQNHGIIPGNIVVSRYNLERNSQRGFLSMRWVLAPVPDWLFISCQTWGEVLPRHRIKLGLDKNKKIPDFLIGERLFGYEHQHVFQDLECQSPVTCIFSSSKYILPENCLSCKLLWNPLPTLLSRNTVYSIQSDSYFTWSLYLLSNAHTPPMAWQGIDHQMHSIILARRIRVQWSLAPSMLGTNQDDLGLDPGAHIVPCCVDISPPRFHQGLRDSPGRQYCTIKATQVE